MIFLFHPSVGLYCNTQCAKDDGLRRADLSKLKKTTADDIYADLDSLEPMEDSDYWYWNDEGDDPPTTSPQCGHCCNYCMEVVWE